MARSERRILGFTVAILILALAVGLLGWGNRHDASERRRLQAEAVSNRARVDQLEHQLRDHGIEPAAPTTTSTTAVRRPHVTSTTAVRLPPTTRPRAETTTTTTRPSSPSTTSSTRPPPPPPPSTTSTTACAVQLLGRCVP